MQSVSSRIWTRVAVSISYDDNHYTTGTSKLPYGKAPVLLLNANNSLIICLHIVKWFQVLLFNTNNFF